MKNKIYSILILFTGLLILNSCTKDFEKINTNGNAPAAEQAAPDMLLTLSIESLTDRVYDIFLGHEMGSCWVQHMAKVQYTDEDRYIYRPDVVNGTWTSLYARSGMDIETIRRIAVSKDLKNYKAVAYVLRAYGVSLLTDMFGDVPYTEAFKAIDDITATLPKYDTQESIYRDLIAKLDSANILLSDDNETINGDILFDGDVTSWKKFANSLRLRLLLRMSAKDVGFVTSEMSKMVADPDTYPIFESNADNADLVYLGSAPNNNPINENRKTRDDHRVSKTIIDVMWTTNPNVDWRIVVYANLAAGPSDYVGLPNGLLAADALNYNGNGLKETCKIGDYFTSASCPGMLMSYAELQYILAEAAVKGYVPGGMAKAEEYYLAGLFGSYRQFGDVLIANAADIFGQEGTIDDFAQDYIDNSIGAFDNSSMDAALEIIGREKWLAMFDQGLQAFIEYRRTGIPALEAPEKGNNGTAVPSRYPYPTDERSRNGANLGAAVTSQGFSSLDDLNGKVWWNN